MNTLITLDESIETEYSQMHAGDLDGTHALSEGTCIGNCCSSSSTSKADSA